jgi:hypothetical protein
VPHEYLNKTGEVVRAISVVVHSEPGRAWARPGSAAAATGRTAGRRVSRCRGWRTSPVRRPR